MYGRSPDRLGTPRVVQLVTEDDITDLAVQRWATAHDPRTAELMTALVRHLHDFAREVRLTGTTSEVSCHTVG